MYYAMILISVLFSGVRMFSGDVYRRLRGDSLWISLEYSILASIAGVLLLVPYNGFRIEYTHFTLAVCLFCTALNLTHMFCTFRVLGIINLSLYSMFAMLGNMLLPFVAGILFFGEPLTVGKGICLVFLIDFLHEKHFSLEDFTLRKVPIVLRWIMYIALTTLIIWMLVYDFGQSASTFIYERF